MSSIDPSAAQAAIFEKLGISKNTDVAKATSNSLGQSEFLKLMTTQLQNQDPFAPMDNGDFIGQMAQFSTVTGISEVNSSLDRLVDKFDQGRIATAANLLGHSVLVPGNISRPDENGELHGVLDLPQATSMAKIVISDADTGEELDVMDLGPKAAGLVGFSWLNIPTEIQNSNKRIKIDATINFGDGPQQLNPSVYSRVLSASVGSGDTEQVLIDVQDFGEMDVSTAVNFR
ncbi:MAG: flagellar hook assembly protein FlgD [Flavobacteriales bacterium]|jgi:flagellar basal-body rod modification protein FlgD|tara:strand:- start:469 stop:1161 length:693 start_codon:yes stop_codon:yes gene_type:complete